MSVQNFSLLDYYEVAEKFRGDVFNFNPRCIELELGLSYDNLQLISLLSIIDCCVLYLSLLLSRADQTHTLEAEHQ